MNVLARRLGPPTALALVLAGCQSILGIDTDRPLVTGEPDGGPNVQDDASSPDAGTGAEATTGAPDSGSGSDSSAGVDATEASAPDAGAPDAGAPDAGGDVAPPASFTNPIQIDVSALFNANSVVTTTVGGMALTPMDGTSVGDNNDFPTQSMVVTLSSTGRGLPDDGSFASNGTSIPSVQLAWRNASNVANSVVVSSTAGTTYTFDVPPARYSQVQIYATGAGGASTLNYSLTYSDSSTSQSTLSLPDWCLGTPGSGQYVLASVDRVENGSTFNANYLCNVYALDLNPDTGKSLRSVSMQDTGGATTYLVFYGATAW
jgi:hypothetical protein